MKHIITITGASGAGKDTLVDALLYLNCVKAPTGQTLASKFYNKLEQHSGHLMYRVELRELISHTTRAPRVGEQDGIDYHFIDLDTFKAISKVEETEYAGNHYCLAESELQNIPDDSFGIVIVDQHGVECITSFVKNHLDDFTLTSVFLKINEDISRARMLARGDNPEAIGRRLIQQTERGEYIPNKPDMYTFIFESCNIACLEENVQKLQTYMLGFLD